MGFNDRQQPSKTKLDQPGGSDGSAWFHLIWWLPWGYPPKSPIFEWHVQLSTIHFGKPHFRKAPFGWATSSWWGANVRTCRSLGPSHSQLRSTKVPISQRLVDLFGGAVEDINGYKKVQPWLWIPHKLGYNAWLHYLITGSAPPSNGMMRKSIPWESQERHLDDCIQTYRHVAVTADSYLDRETNVFNMDCLWEAQWLIMSLCSCLIQSIEMGLSNNRGTLNHQF